MYDLKTDPLERTNLAYKGYKRTPEQERQYRRLRRKLDRGREDAPAAAELSDGRLAEHRRLVDDDLGEVLGIDAHRDLRPRLQATDHEPADGLSRLCSESLAPWKLDLELHRDRRPLIDVGASLAQAEDGGLAGEPVHLRIGLVGPEDPAEQSHRPTPLTGAASPSACPVQSAP